MKVDNLSPWIWLLVTGIGFAFYFYVLIDLIFIPLGSWPPNPIGEDFRVVISKSLFWIQYKEHCHYLIPTDPIVFLLVAFSIPTGFSIGKYCRTQEAIETFSMMKKPLIVSIVLFFSATWSAIFLIYWIISISLDLPSSYIVVIAPLMISILFIISVILGNFKKQHGINTEEEIINQNGFLILLIVLIVVIWYLSSYSTVLVFYGYPCQ